MALHLAIDFLVNDGRVIDYFGTPYVQGPKSRIPLTWLVEKGAVFTEVQHMAMITGIPEWELDGIRRSICSAIGEAKVSVKQEEPTP